MRDGEGELGLGLKLILHAVNDIARQPTLTLAKAVTILSAMVAGQLLVLVKDGVDAVSGLESVAFGARLLA